jgi:hypothetical protein
MDDFSNIDDYMGSEMNESGCIGSPAVRKLGCGIKSWITLTLKKRMGLSSLSVAIKCTKMDLLKINLL